MFLSAFNGSYGDIIVPIRCAGDSGKGRRFVIYVIKLLLKI